jgi:hypothetical protein
MRQKLKKQLRLVTIHFIYIHTVLCIGSQYRGYVSLTNITRYENDYQSSKQNDYHWPVFLIVLIYLYSGILVTKIVKGLVFPHIWPLSQFQLEFRIRTTDLSIAGPMLYLLRYRGSPIPCEVFTPSSEPTILMYFPFHTRAVYLHLFWMRFGQVNRAKSCSCRGRTLKWLVGSLA